MSPKKTTKKKTVKKTTVAKKKTPVSKKQGGTIYVLIIMILLATMLIMYNQFQRDSKKSTRSKIITADELFEKKNTNPKKNNYEKRIEIKKEANKETDSIQKEKIQKIDKKSSVKVYFLVMDSKTEKIRLRSSKRIVSDKDLVKNSLSQLIKGLSNREKKIGLLSAVSSKIKVRSVLVKGTIAIIDFNGAIEIGATGSILMKRIQQIVYTATQFKEISGIKIKINGSNRKTLGADGLSIAGILRRGQF